MESPWDLPAKDSPPAGVQVRSLGWEFPHAMDAARKQNKTTKLAFAVIIKLKKKSMNYSSEEIREKNPSKKKKNPPNKQEIRYYTLQLINKYIADMFEKISIIDEFSHWG